MNVNFGTIDVGNRRRIIASFTADDGTGAFIPSNPAHVYYKVQPPNGSPVTYTFGVDSNITNPVVGTFKCTISFNLPGTWLIRVYSTDANGIEESALDGFMVVNASSLA